MTEKSYPIYELETETGIDYRIVYESYRNQRHGSLYIGNVFATSRKEAIKKLKFFVSSHSEETPFPTSNLMDPESGASLRMYHGSLFGQNQRANVHDVIWGSTLVPEYAMKVALPL